MLLPVYTGECGKRLPLGGGLQAPSVACWLALDFPWSLVWGNQHYELYDDGVRWGQHRQSIQDKKRKRYFELYDYVMLMYEISLYEDLDFVLFTRATKIFERRLEDAGCLVHRDAVKESAPLLTWLGKILRLIGIEKRAFSRVLQYVLNRL